MFVGITYTSICLLPYIACFFRRISVFSVLLAVYPVPRFFTAFIREASSNIPVNVSNGIRVHLRWYKREWYRRISFLNMRKPRKSSTMAAKTDCNLLEWHLLLRDGDAKSESRLENSRWVVVFENAVHVIRPDHKSFGE